MQGEASPLPANRLLCYICIVQERRGGKRNEKTLLRITCIGLAVMLLAACSRQNGVDDSDNFDLKDKSGGLLSQGDEKKGGASDADGEAYLLSTGMDFARKGIDALIEQSTELREQTVKILQGEEIYRILSLPLTDEIKLQIVTAWKALSEEDENEIALTDDEQKLYLTWPASNYFMDLQHYSINQLEYESEKWTEAVRMSRTHVGRTIAAPPADTGERLMLLLFGDRDAPTDGVYILFENVADGIVSVSTGMLWEELVTLLQRTFPQWFDEGTWYTQEEILTAEKQAEGISRDIEPVSVGNVNQFLIETAMQLHDTYMNKLENVGTAMFSVCGIEDTSLLTQTIQAGKGFDLAAIMTSKSSFPNGDSASDMLMDWAGYPAAPAYALNRLYPTTAMPVPTEWTSDAKVLLGSESSPFFATVSFSHDLFQSGVALSASYSFAAMPEGKNFTDIQQFLMAARDEYNADAKLIFASPYGVWDSFGDIKNLYTAY